MKMFYESCYSHRLVVVIYLLLTILLLLYLVYRFIKNGRGILRTAAAILTFIAACVLYCVLIDDHIVPVKATEWQSHYKELPMPLLWIIISLVFAAAVFCIIRDYEAEKKTVGKYSIKKALDEIPVGICYFHMDGTPVLCNRQMYELSEAMFGRLFVGFDDLKYMLESRSDWKKTYHVYRFPDGAAWRYMERSFRTEDGTLYIAANFFNVSEISNRKIELEMQTKELQNMSLEIRRLSENTKQLARQEEMLSMKSTWHDIMGEGLAAIRSSLLCRGNDESIEAALIRWKRAVVSIKRDNEEENQRRDDMGDLYVDASAVGIKLDIEGEMPEDEDISEIFALIIRNCLLNALQHAKATEVYAVIREKFQNHVICITNNGEAPVGEITPKGGLLNVKNHVEYIGGQLLIRSAPSFMLTAVIPCRED